MEGVVMPEMGARLNDHSPKKSIEGMFVTTAFDHS